MLGLEAAGIKVIQIDEPTIREGLPLKRSDWDAYLQWAGEAFRLSYMGVYDIHSPRVPKAEEIEYLLRKALTVVPKERLWVNPDCGLKTRGWKETIEQLQVMVDVTKKLRKELG